MFQLTLVSSLSAIGVLFISFIWIFLRVSVYVLVFSENTFFSFLYGTAHKSNQLLNLYCFVVCSLHCMFYVIYRLLQHNHLLFCLSFEHSFTLLNYCVAGICMLKCVENFFAQIWNEKKKIIKKQKTHRFMLRLTHTSS